jgi:hypothetical protein
VLKEFGIAKSAFGFPTTDENAREIDRYINDNPDAQYFKKEFAGLESFQLGERSDVSVITDDSIDHDGEVVDCNSIVWDEFKKNPLVAFGHNYEIPPIGRSLWQKQVANQWKAKTQYVSRPANLATEVKWFPDEVYHLIKEGFLPGKSIGAVGKVRTPTTEDIAEKPFLKGARKIRYDIKVYEYSVVVKNCNKNAVVEAVAKGLVTLPEEILNKHFSELSQLIIDAKKSIAPPKEEEKETYVLKSVKFAKTQEEIIKEAVADLNKKTPELVDDCLAKILGRV